MAGNKKQIYLDNAATTRVDEEVFGIMKPYFCDKFGNASSAHALGREAREAVEKARSQAAEFLGCKAEEIIFTSGATESNNLAIKGVISKGLRQAQGKSFLPHIITTKIEHHCVLDSCENLEKSGLAEVTYLPVNNEGIIEPEELKKAIRENTILVSVMYANNEIGTIQPIKELGKLLKEINSKRSADKKIYFHTDAVQAANYLDCDVNILGADLLSFSAHKFYGPKGVGALFIKKGTPVKKIQDGGAHESNLRAGTYNTAGIVGMGAAIQRVISEKSKVKNIQNLRDKMIDAVLKIIPNSRLNGSREKRLPNNANFSFRGAEGEAVMMALDAEGIAISTGSACASENLAPSHVLTAIGLGPEDSHTSIRVTLGRQTTENDIDDFVKILEKTLAHLRQISGMGGSAKKDLPADFGC
ncbi:MAG: cysteine desulfurase family protein [Candidatus Portnoybacteria bacterium]|nr:cysteine desulfurase family protein [Candidatus Portnoybacteria bacterium]